MRSAVVDRSGEGRPMPSPAPLISIVVPVYRTKLTYLRELLDSVLAQSNPDWELVLIDDCSRDPALTALLRSAAADDSRIRVEELDVNSGIVAASNRGLAVATGSFVALLDHDDILDPSTVQFCGDAIRIAPDSDVLYTDERIIGPDGDELGEFRKPIFSPERLRGQMFTLHLSVFRRSLLHEIGGFRAGFDGSQDYDLILRASERARRISSIPHPLYSWRILPTSVSHSEGNDYVFESARKALADHLARTGIDGSFVQISDAPMFRVDRVVPAGLTVSIIVTSATGYHHEGTDEPAVVAAVRRLVADAGDRLADVTVIIGGSAPGNAAPPVEQLSALVGARGRVDVVDGDPRSSAVINAAMIRSRGDLVLLIDDIVTPLAVGWLTVLLGQASAPGVIAVGPRVIGPDGRLAAAGLSSVLGRLVPIGGGSDRTDPGPFGGLQLTREVTALTPECLVLDRAEFLRVGGLSLTLWGVAAVVDLSLKGMESGQRTVLAAGTEVRLDQPGAGTWEAESEPLRLRWGPQLTVDRYWRDV